MTTKSKTAFDRLDEAIRAIQSLNYDIERAQRLPDQLAGNVSSLTIGHSSYGSRDAEAAEIAELVKKNSVQQARELGEQRRDEALRTIALKLESLRAVLPQLAAAASIYLGQLARDIKP